MTYTVNFDPTFESWRDATRPLLRDRIPPSEVMWVEASAAQHMLPGLLPSPDITEPRTPRTQFQHPPPTVPHAFIDLARHAAYHRNVQRWHVLYRVLWRLVHENPHLLCLDFDDDVRTLKQLDRQVRNDAHKMQAFVRFRLLVQDGVEQYVAWHRPDHYIVPLVAPFFVERFRVMRWSILTPDCSVHWDRRELRFTEGAPRSHAPAEDELEELWRTYYGAVFNPARVNITAMRAEMPVRYWSALPETRIIPRLLSEASGAVDAMVRFRKESTSAASFLPPVRTIPVLRDTARRCMGCELHRCATQTVFGEGPIGARIVLIGEQPGDQEDVEGRPFVGPAGDVLNRALTEAGLLRDRLYLTNAVKHFKFVLEGKRRKHKAPSYREVVACRPWLDAELSEIRPDIVVCLGATAAKSLLGAQFQLLKQRSTFFRTPWAQRVIATVHPSAVLRARDHASAEVYEMLLHDLRLVAAALRDAPAVLAAQD